MNYKELISYDDKVNLYSNSNIPAENKVQDTDMNNIKNVVNGVINGTNVMGNIVVDSIRSKNILKISNYGSVDWNFNSGATGTFGENIITINSSGSPYSGVYGQLFKFANLDSNKTYTISFDIVANNTTSIQYGISDALTTVSIGTTTQKLSYTYTGDTLTGKNAIFYCMTTAVRTLTISNIQIEEGNTATTYSPYQNLDGYDNYSTSETIIGTFLGKPLYRKVIDCGNLPNNDTKSVAHNISNIERTIRCFGSAKYGAYFLDLPYLAISSGSISGANSIGATADATNINIITGTNRTSWSAYVVVEYTKTTD